MRFSISSASSLCRSLDISLDRDLHNCQPRYSNAQRLGSGGTHADCHLNLPDIGTRLWYLPGTAVAVSGRVLRHEVPDWLEGERICCAHFIKDAVHDRLGEARPVWPCLTDYFTLIDT